MNCSKNIISLHLHFAQICTFAVISSGIQWLNISVLSLAVTHITYSGSCKLTRSHRKEKEILAQQQMFCLSLSLGQR